MTHENRVQDETNVLKNNDGLITANFKHAHCVGDRGRCTKQPTKQT